MIAKLAGEMKSRREGKGLSLSQVARLAKVSRSTVQRIEGGDDSVALSTIFAYASALDLQEVLARSMLDAVRRTAPRGVLSEVSLAKLELMEKMKNR
jgi:transcriptional regulator with XRE-family HTH domain